MKAAIGVAIVAAHAIGFAALAQRSTGTPLRVDLTAPLAFDGTPTIAASVTTDAGPGLRHRTWTTSYRGGFTREVGASQLVGPFQDPAAPACSGRIVIGQRLLDDGRASHGTIAGAMEREIDAELRGENVFPIGEYKRTERLSLRWATLAAHPRDREIVGTAPHGYVRATATLVFERVSVPIVVALVPERTDSAIHFRIAANAELGFGNAIIQWVSDKLDIAKLATRFARRQIDDALVTTLAPPPPFEFGDGQTLTFTYCDGPIEIVDGAYAAVPFAVAIGHRDHIAPPRFGKVIHTPPTTGTSLAIDLDLDALDAMLFELWRTGWLDRQLATVGLDRTFNSDATVLEYLSLRLSPLHLALPPVIEPGPAGALRLVADARVAIADGDVTTIGRLYGALDFHFAQFKHSLAPVAVDLGALELSCERTPTSLVPCYGDLVAALRDRGGEFHGALTAAFAKLLADIFVDRHLGASGLPAELVIHGSRPSLVDGAVHLELDASLM